MPGGDRTGPIGRGSRTGRAAGYCAGFSSPGYMTSGFGRGFGRGIGRGFWGRRRLWREPYYSEPYYTPNQIGFPNQNKEEEKNYLENLVKGLEEEIKDIQKRLKQLSEEKEK